MSILKVAKLGNPVLREIAKPIPLEEIKNSEIQRLIQDMIETMREYEGVGLAAPQVHKSLQICVIESIDRSRGEDGNTTPLMVLINPVLTIVSENLHEDWEGCLSIPDLRGLVPRYRQIKVQAYDSSGRVVDFQAQDFLARVIQHEHDHLMAKVFFDRMRSFESLSYLQEFARYWQRKEGENSG